MNGRTARATRKQAYKASLDFIEKHKGLDFLTRLRIAVSILFSK